MLISTSAQAGRQNVTTAIVDGQSYEVDEYIGSSPKPGSPGYGSLAAAEDAPQAYLVIQPPHSVTRPHFHHTNQYQVFVAGGGRVGKLRADPVTVQFAGGHTPYGPIRAEGDGISYFTLRQRIDTGAKYMPEMRDSLERGRQRQRVGVVQPGELASGDGPADVFPPEDDGLLALHYRLAPGQTASTPDTAPGGGQYHVVVSGAMVRGEALLPQLSIEWASPDEGAVPLVAGPDGAEVLVLRFPR